MTFISQEKYLREMLKRFKMEDCKPVSNPMITGCKLCADDGSADIDQRHYRSMIGSLLYLTASRPNIVLAVGLVARIFSTKTKSLPSSQKNIQISTRNCTVWAMVSKRQELHFDSIYRCRLGQLCG